MEPMNALDHSYITAVIILLQDLSIEYIIRKVFRKFNFFDESGLLQFWACSSTPPNSEDVGCHLMLTGKPFVSTQDNEELEDHRMRCLENNDRFVGLETRVGNWIAGRAVQTGIADHKTIHSAEAAGKGQLVVPVFHNWGSGKKLVGIIELVTIVPKESYFADFRQICNLLQEYGLESKYMGKMIKVEYNNNLIKFPLSYSATLTDLHKKVTKRFKELGQINFHIDYRDAMGNRYPISSDVMLRSLLAESSQRGETLLRMFVEHV